LNPERANRNRRCEVCGRFCGTHDRSVVHVAAARRETGAEEAWRLCPPCAFAPDSSVASRAFWRAWRRDAVAITR
jgi:hypothetical protein